MTTRCGFIGLGSQGGPMARRMIDAGLPTVLWARRAESLDPYRDSDATFARSIAELGRLADHVGICVVDDDDVRQVCAELLAAMRPGGLVAIHSTVHPDTVRDLAGQAAERGLHLLDAPVSGGSPAAAAGVLTVMCGGDAKTFATAKPVLETFGRLIVLLGEVGAGQLAKLINNALLAANLAHAHDALTSGGRLGLDRAALVELLNHASGRSMGLEVYARMPAPAAFEHGGKILAKDLRLLGEVLGPDDPAFASLNAAAGPFLELVRTSAAKDGR